MVHLKRPTNAINLGDITLILTEDLIPDLVILTNLNIEAVVDVVVAEEGGPEKRAHNNNT